MDKLYKHSLDSVRALDTSLGQNYCDSSDSQGIRAEIKRLLIKLAFSQLTASRDQKIHYLFMALAHLDNVEKEIRISDVSEEIVRLERIFDRIRSLQQLLFEYIGHLI